MAHASQIAPDSFFLRCRRGVLRVAFGTEWFIEVGAERAPAAPFAPAILPGLSGGPPLPRAGRPGAQVRSRLWVSPYPLGSWASGASSSKKCPPSAR